MNTLISRSMPFLALVAASALPLPAHAQSWQTPYTPGSSADQTLTFTNGAGGTATSPNIPFAIGLSVNDSTPGLGSGGGWGLSAIGTAAVGVGVTIVGETHTQTEVTPGELNFNIVSTGVAQIVGLTMNSQWTAATGPIAGSGSWVVPSNSFRYTFDAVLSNDILTLSPSLFNQFTLTIQAGANILYQQTGLSTILPSLSPSVIGAAVEFAYDPATQGDLQITWSASPLVTTSLLEILGDGENLIFGIRNGAVEVDAVPEPTTMALLTGAAGYLLLRRRRRLQGERRPGKSRG